MGRLWSPTGGEAPGICVRQPQTGATGTRMTITKLRVGLILNFKRAKLERQRVVP